MSETKTGVRRAAARVSHSAIGLSCLVELRLLTLARRQRIEERLAAGDGSLVGLHALHEGLVLGLAGVARGGRIGGSGGIGVRVLHFARTHDA